MATSRRLRLPEIRSLDDPAFEQRIIAPLAEKVAAGYSTQRAADDLINAIYPWIRQFSTAMYRAKTSSGTSVGSDEAATLSEVHMAIYRCATKLRWDDPKCIKPYLTQSASRAVQQAARVEDNLNRRHRAYLKTARVAVDRATVQAGRPLTADERDATIRHALLHDVVPSIRPSEDSVDSWVEAVLMVWFGSSELARTDDPEVPDVWETVSDDDGDHATRVFETSESQSIVEVMHEWLQTLPSSVRKSVEKALGMGIPFPDRANYANDGDFRADYQKVLRRCSNNFDKGFSADLMQALAPYRESLLARMQQSGVTELPDEVPAVIPSPPPPTPIRAANAKPQRKAVRKPVATKGKKTSTPAKPVSQGASKSKHGNVMNELMQDGKSHTIDDFMAAAGRFIPASQALGRSETKTAGMTLAERRTQGRRKILANLAYDRVRKGQWTVTGKGDNKQYKLNAKSVPVKSTGRVAA